MAPAIPIFQYSTSIDKTQIDQQDFIWCLAVVHDYFIFEMNYNFRLSHVHRATHTHTSMNHDIVTGIESKHISHNMCIVKCTFTLYMVRLKWEKIVQSTIGTQDDTTDRSVHRAPGQLCSPLQVHTVQSVNAPYPHRINK